MNSVSTKIHYLLLFIPLFAIISCKLDEEVNIIYPDGGYPYLLNVTPKDSNFYFLPIRHLFSTPDSFLVLNEKFCFDAFNEPNLSVSTPKEDIFRFCYGCGLCGKYAIVILTKDRITLKANRGLGDPYPHDSTNLLSPTEKEYYHLMDIYINFKYRYSELSSSNRHYLDSMIKLNPQLTDPNYYLQVKKKASVFYSDPFTYTTRKVNISKEKFKYFVNLINESGFWQRKFKEECFENPTDGDGFYLEAITKKKYHLVISNYCLDGPSKFKKTGEEIMKYIGFNLEAFYRESIHK